MRPLIFAMAALSAGCGCLSPGPGEGAVRLELAYEGFRPACIRVLASDADNPALTAEPEELEAPSVGPAVVAIFPGEGWSRRVSLVATAHEKDCAGKEVDREEDRSVEVPAGGITRRSLTFEAVDADQDGYVAQASGGTDCDDGAPAANPSVSEVCGDGLDNDCNGQADCQDRSACAGATCDDGDSCTDGDACLAEGGCLGTARACGTPPSACHADAGTCALGLCSYPLLSAGTPCGPNAGNACTVAPDTCNGSGLCTPGAQRTCSSPPGVCFADAGVCDSQDGGCTYAVKAGAACADSDPCTWSGVCDGTGACTFQTTLCNQPPECKTGGPSACDGDGGCNYGNAGAVTCGDGGRCLAGECKPIGPFPYLPSNFNPAGLDYSATVQIDCPTAAFDSTDGGFTICPGRNAPGVTLQNQPGGGEVYVLSMDRLDLSSGGVIRLTGSRPVIFAVASTSSKTQLDGLIDARALLGVPGAGGNDLAACGPRAGAPGAYLTEGGGGGGAGLRTAGARGGAGGSGAAAAGDGGVAGAGGVLTDGGVPAGSPWMPLVGGCPGGTGGRSSAAQEGFAGAGGGAVQLSVAGELEIANGIVTVSGGGGQGAVSGQAGGGGGGSGGTILLEANRMTIGNSNSRLTANGGAGGEGESNGGTNGADGQNGSANSATPATCPSNSTSGGTGGDGAAGTTGPAAGQQQSAGGGGGGGAAGRIWLRASGAAALCQVTAGVRSPPFENAGGCP